MAWRVEVAETLRRARAGQTAGVYVARNQEETLGFAAYGAQRRRLFGPMGTGAAARGTGIGSRLLRECLADQFVAGLERADIGWVGPGTSTRRSSGHASRGSTGCPRSGSSPGKGQRAGLRSGNVPGTSAVECGTQASTGGVQGRLGRRTVQPAPHHDRGGGHVLVG